MERRRKTAYDDITGGEAAAIVESKKAGLKIKGKGSNWSDDSDTDFADFNWHSANISRVIDV
jgi:hypothetical protein